MSKRYKNVPPMMVGSRTLIDNTSDPRERKTICRILKEICIKHQDFEKAAKFRDLERWLNERNSL